MQDVNHIIKENVKTFNKLTKKRLNVDRTTVEFIAHRLADKLDDKESIGYFCTVAMNLTESQIWSNYEQAITGRNPKKYFTFLCNLQMK